MGTESEAALSYSKAGIVLIIDLCSLIAGKHACSNGDFPERSSPNFFVFGLSLADFLMAILVMTPAAVALIEQDWVLGSFGSMFFACLTIALSCISLHTMAFTAVNRFVRIVRQEKCATIFTRRTTILMNLLVWFHGLCYGVLYIWASGGGEIFINRALFS